MVLDDNGNLFGATAGGGASNCNGPEQCGTVFELSPPARNGDQWVETVLYVFKGLTNSDGAGPEGGLVADQEGNLYGTTAYDGSGQCKLVGGLVGCGTVYELSPSTKVRGRWTETVLYNFQGSSDGYFPRGDLVRDTAGNLYGATQYGGGYGTDCNDLYGYCGTIFELTPPGHNTKGTWTERILYSFKGTGPSAVGDGSEPNGGLILDSSGALYGTTYFGGNGIGLCNSGVGGIGCGTAFKLEAPSGGRGGTWVETVLHRFTGYSDGANPAGGLILAEPSRLYGTTFAGAQNGYGAVFELFGSPGISGIWSARTLYEFNPKGGVHPSAGVVFGLGDVMYGTSTQDGTSGGGTFFSLASVATHENAWVETVLHSFAGGSSDASYPDSKLIFQQPNFFYGSSQSGGDGLNCGFGGCGTIFRVQP